jgi:protocatechuate 3,4-dioxygenase beta subunit
MMLTRRSALLGITSRLLVGGSGAGAQLRTTPTGDLGPFYPILRGRDSDNDLTMVRGRGGRASGQIIEVAGRVLDLRGNPVGGARIELWQANAAGRYAHPADTNPAPVDPNFQGFAKLSTGRDGSYRYISVKPGAYPDGDDSPRPPHVHLDVSGRTDRVVTQMLFPGEPLNETDDVVPKWARARLTAIALGQGPSGALRFRWDIILDIG